MSTAQGSEEAERLRAELQASRAENEILLQQITRLCLHIESNLGVDPIEIMHGRTPAVKSPLAAEAPGGWLRGLFSGRSGSRSNDASADTPSSRRSTQVPAPSFTASADMGGSVDRDHDAGRGAGISSGSSSSNGGIPLDDELLPVHSVAGASFEWRGDPEAIDELERKLAESRSVAEVVLNGTGLTRLPSGPSMWLHLSRTLSSLSLNSNSLMELPSSVSKLQQLRKLRLEGNLLRELPVPILDLKRLEELGLGCNQLTGLPDGIGGLTSLMELWLVSNEISYLPTSMGSLSRLQKLELSANALHELPRSLGKLSSITHLWLGDNSIATFPQHLCALDTLEHLDLSKNQISIVPRAAGTMPALKTLLLADNPLTFPPTGVVAQGSVAVLEYIRRHKHSDVQSSEAERSIRQIAAYRDRLASTIDAQEESLRQAAAVYGSESGRTGLRIEDAAAITFQPEEPERPEEVSEAPPSLEDGDHLGSEGAAAGLSRPPPSRIVGGGEESTRMGRPPRKTSFFD